MPLYVYIIAAFVGGFIVALLIHFIKMAGAKKEIKSLQGLLESEKLIKETGNKENNFLLQSAEANLITLREQLRKTNQLNIQMDNDILLLQKSNEETEALLQKSEPALYDLKLKLIEAQNTIARYKAVLGEK